MRSRLALLLEQHESFLLKENPQTLMESDEWPDVIATVAEYAVDLSVRKFSPLSEQINMLFRQLQEGITGGGDRSTIQDDARFKRWSAVRKLRYTVDAIDGQLDTQLSVTNRLLSNPSNCSDHPGPVLFFDGAG